MITYTPNERMFDSSLPNLFNYAKKELSQDAFLCWSLEWINTDGHEMCKFAHLLLESFINCSLYKGKINSFDIERVEIKPQYKQIDILVLAQLKDKRILPIIIEDKINTFYHGDQLDRYRKNIIQEYKDFFEPICIYYKTGFIYESQSEIKEHHYIVYGKEKILEIMNNFQNTKMPLLFCDYFAYLTEKQSHENSVF